MVFVTGCIGETFIIDGHIRITIRAVEEERVYLEVDAPETVPVHCPEVHSPRGAFVPCERVP
jgi:sRNA-binding carbon storage regulator CsrA